MQNSTQISSLELNTLLQTSTPKSTILNTLLQSLSSSILSSKINQKNSYISYPSILSTLLSLPISETENTSLSLTNSIFDSKISFLSSLLIMSFFRFSVESAPFLIFSLFSLVFDLSFSCLINNLFVQK